ncbi:Uncharacterised protein [Mycoplasmopsis californica]|uniref:Uncharacterized protein n=1 Tax=Mycoplasmopsis equigenitalium TaxID=114883 RepID=A0ABY5J0U0_9BACT|nr:hypothetical protein [Mycoplasmopsis equigenitalium]UUD36869.1 hypothetical protein NPA09_03155 [Mycoplasmopsis equigenitalium]VEU69836.1 Uncharacterised protein [Mycoplasmopsis californica]
MYDDDEEVVVGEILEVTQDHEVPHRPIRRADPSTFKVKGEKTPKNKWFYFFIIAIVLLVVCLALTISGAATLYK